MLCLGLDRTPATDLIDGTVLAWHEALTDGRAWDRERDAERIRRAFVTLAKTREAWPQPKHLIEALPKIEQAAIGYEVKPASREEAEAAMAQIKAMLSRRGEPEPEAKPADESKPDLAGLEAELQRHYDRKRAAAGDVP